MSKAFKYFFLSVTFILLVFKEEINAQGAKIDSLYKKLKTCKEDSSKVNILNAISFELRNSKVDSAAIAALQALHLAEKLKWEFGIGKTSHQLAICNRIKGDYHLALDNNYTALNSWEQIEKKEKDLKIINIVKARKSGTLGNLGLIYWNLGNYHKALEFYFKSLKLAEELNDKNRIAIQLNNIGNVYPYLNENTKAIEYYLKALKIDSELGNKSGVSIDLGNIAVAYTNEGQFEKALEYHFKALDLASFLNNKASIAVNYGNIGNIHFRRGLLLTKGKSQNEFYDKALEYYFKALNIFTELKDKKSAAINLGDVGVVYMHAQKYSDAEKYLLKSLQICDSIGALDYSREYEEALSELYTKTFKAKLAYEHYKKYISARDSLFNNENTKKNVRAQMAYDFNKKDQAAKLIRERKNALAEKEKQKQIIVRNSFVFGFVFVLLLALLIFRGYKNKQKANLIISKQKEEVEFSKRTIEDQKREVEEKQKEILDSIHYAKRIQTALITSEKYIERNLRRLNG